MNLRTPLPSTPFFFVYGTLKKGHGNHRLVEPFVVDSEEAIIPGYILAISGFIPFAIPDAASFVKGELLRIDHSHLVEATAILDRLENEGRLYFRKEVVTTNGQRCSMYAVPERYPGMEIIGSEYTRDLLYGPAFDVEDWGEGEDF